MRGGDTLRSVLVQCPECYVLLEIHAPLPRRKKCLYYARCDECFIRLRIDVPPEPTILRGAGSFVAAAANEDAPIQVGRRAYTEVSDSDTDRKKNVTGKVLHEYVTLKRALDAKDFCLDAKHLDLATAPRCLFRAGELIVYKYTEMKKHALLVHGSEKGVIAAAKLRTQNGKHAKGYEEIRENLPRDLVNAGLVVEEGNARYVDYFYAYAKKDGVSPRVELVRLVQILSEEKYLRENIDDDYVGPLRVARERCFKRLKGENSMWWSYHYGISTHINEFESEDKRPVEDDYAMVMSCPRGLESAGWPAKWPWLSEHWSRDTHATFPTAFRRRVQTFLLCLKVTCAVRLHDDIVDFIVQQEATTSQLWF